MTTIATDGKSMAGDGLASRGDIAVLTTREKVKRLPDGSLFGGCGNSADVDAFWEWMNGGAKPKPKDNITVLVLRPSGEIHYFDRTLTQFEADAPFAIGSGGELALGALEAGVSPERAVQIAAKRDCFTGGQITVLHLSEPQLRVA